MIASDDPWVRAPVVSPGAWKRSAIIRMQRCSISAVGGYSAWSMKFRCRFAAMSRCASGSIQVVTKVARFRAGSPSSAISSDTRRKASTAVMPLSGNVRVGTSREANRLPNRAASRSMSILALGVLVMRSPKVVDRLGGRAGLVNGLSPGREHQSGSDQEAQSAEKRARDIDPEADHVTGSGQDEAGYSRDHEQDRSDHVQPRDTPRNRPRPPTPEGPGCQNAERAGDEEQRRSVDVRAPHVPVLLLHRCVEGQGGQRAPVEEQRPGKLR